MRHTLPLSLSQNDASFSFTRIIITIKQQSPKTIVNSVCCCCCCDVFCFFFLLLLSCYIPSLNSFRFYSFSEALAHNIDADLAYIQYYCNGTIFYCCCYCRLCYFTFFFHLISCVISSLVAISCSFYMLYSVVCECVCVYIVVMSTDERTSKLNVTIFILIRLFNLVVCVCSFFFLGAIPNFTSLQTHSTDKYKFISNSALNNFCHSTQPVGFG